MSGAQPLDHLCLPKDVAVVTFLNELRREFLAKRYKANGSLKPDAARDERIEGFVRSYRAPLSLRDRSDDFSQAVTLLLTRFERIRERTGRSQLDNKFAVQVYRYLADQLRQNIEFFRFPDFDKLVTPTLMTSEPLVSLPAKFAENNIPTERRLFYRAFTDHSQHVVEFFERGAEKLNEIERQLAAHPTWKMSKAQKHHLAFFRQPQDSKALLKSHISTVNTLLKTQPFSKWFHGQRSIVEAVVSRFKINNVRHKLRELHTLTEKLKNDPDLTVFKNRKSAVLYAALSHFSFNKAKEHLQRAHKLEVMLVKRHQENGLGYSLKEIRDACLKDPKQARRMAELLSLR